MHGVWLTTVGVLCLLRHGRSYLGDASTVDVIRSYGYEADKFSVITDDGYILSMVRIKSSATKLPVLMMHGVLSSSDQWVLRGPGEDLAFILVDEGHDVWLADQRGNFYSRNHTHLNTSQPEFWDFSYHESGLYDIPAFIDTVLQESGTEQLYYVGHSMGTSVYYVMCSLRPEYNQLVRTAVHLSPIAFGLRKSLNFILTFLLQNVDALAETLRRQRQYEFLPRIPLNQRLLDVVCSDDNRELCLFFVHQFCGPPTFTNVTKLRVYLKRLQAGTSMKTMVHLSQIYRSKNFAQFDFGKKKNYVVYGSKTPPAYDLTKVTSPVALFYSDSDVFIDDHSINKLKRLLPNVISSVSIPKYNHIDFLFAENSPTVLYKKIVKLLSNA